MSIVNVTHNFLIEHMLQEIACAKDKHERNSIIRCWRRAACETLAERGRHPALNAVRDTPKRWIVRYVPFWQARESHEIEALLSHILRHYRVSLERPKAI